MKKTNVMRLLEINNIEYKPFSYEITDNKIDGLSVAKKIGKPVSDVYKTLVCQGESNKYYVFILPVNKKLNFKLAAKSVGEKSISLINVSDIKRITGYERGGCSPIGMEKEYLTVISKEAEEKDSFIISAGKIGSQIKINPRDLEVFVDIKFEDII